jgi:hypothetical protein
MPTRIDHITITAPSLDSGDAWLFAQTGVHAQPGGAHPRMGTHNRLLRLGDTLFLEVIAVDPGAPTPLRPRWFELDAMTPAGMPRLACWVARSDGDLAQALARATEDLGVAEPMSRGALTWRLSIRADGSLPLGGVAPALIAWDGDRHPASGLADRGCRLLRLALLHPEPSRLRALLAALDVDEPGVAIEVVAADAPALVADIATPAGLCTIGAAPC